MTKDDLTKFFSRKIGVVAISAWFLFQNFIQSIEFTVIATSYIVCEAFIDAVCKCKRQPELPDEIEE